ncbi:polyprenyl diphosphate synthase [Dehalococcoidia bacterium]|nr:polyprenyl diphosphate synthase [Dehalococcoidia bacterium]
MPETTVPYKTPSTLVVGGQENPGGPNIPAHIAIIMDGNGRWAKRRGLPRLEGHRAGTQRVRRLLESLDNYGVRYVTLFAFSTENWNRPSQEINGLMSILHEVIEQETQNLNDRNVRLLYLGRMDRLSPILKEATCNALDLTKENTGITLSVAFDYGGREEIIQAVKKIVNDGVPAEQIDEELLQKHLYTDGLPDPDLIVRTAGEQRLSNFLIWQSVYSEYYCSPVLWPDFDEEQLAKAIESYSQRKRRFGALIAE